jgi:hypothetical protein
VLVRMCATVRGSCFATVLWYTNCTLEQKSPSYSYIQIQSHTLLSALLLPTVMCATKQMAALQNMIAANAQFEAEVCAVLNSINTTSNGSATTATAGTAVAAIIALQSSLAQAQQQLQQQQQQQQLPVTPASRPRSTSASTSAELTRQWQGLAGHYHAAIVQLATALHVHVDTTSNISTSSSSSASVLAAAQQAAGAVEYGELVAAAGEAVWAQRSLAAVASTLQCAVTDVHTAVQTLAATAATAATASATAAATASSGGHRSGVQQQQQQQQQDAAGWDWDDGDSDDVAGDTDFMGTTTSTTTATAAAATAAAAVAAAEAQLQQFVQDIALQLHCTATSAAVGTAVASLSDVLAALDVELQGGLGGGAGIPGAAEEGQFRKYQPIYCVRTALFLCCFSLLSQQYCPRK